VNGAQSRTLSGLYDVSSYGQLLYYADSLGAGPHILQVTNNPLENAKVTFSVEYANVWEALGGSRGGGTTPVAPKSKSNVGAIVGGVVGGIVCVVLIVVSIILLLRRRRRRRPSNLPKKSFVKERPVHIMLEPRDYSKDASFDLVSRRTMDTTASNASQSSVKNLLPRDLSDGFEPIPMSRIRDTHSTI